MNSNCDATKERREFTVGRCNNPAAFILGRILWVLVLCVLANRGQSIRSTAATSFRVGHFTDKFINDDFDSDPSDSLCH